MGWAPIGNARNRKGARMLFIGIISGAKNAEKEERTLI